MRIVYFDTSALVKVLVEEPGSATAVSTWQAADSVACCRLAHVETRAALAMAKRLGRLSAVQGARAIAALDDHWQDVVAVEVTEAVIAHAGDLAEEDALRGYDAVHLASALRAAVDVLITADGEMLRAGRRHGLDVIDARF